MKKVYYFGEFGCLNYCILGHLEKINPMFEIATQPDYFKLMKLKAPNIIKYKDDNVYRANCIGSGFGFSIDDPYIAKLEDEGFMSLKDFLNLEENRCIKHLLPIKKPLTHEMGLNKKYINISFRKRKHEEERNLDKESWTDVLEIIRNHSSLEIVAHGMDIDTLPSKEFGLKKVDTIEESIAYMNKSKLFIASMSGIAQFASNCASPILQIGDKTRHFEYDPFKKGCYVASMKEAKQKIISLLIKLHY